MHLSIKEGCDGAKVSCSNPRGSAEQGNKLRIQKEKNAIEEHKFSSYLVQVASGIFHKISQNQLVKIGGESTSRAPTNQVQMKW